MRTPLTHTSTDTMCDPLECTNYWFYISVYVDLKSVKEVISCFLGFCDMKHFCGCKKFLSPTGNTAAALHETPVFGVEPLLQ